MARFKIPARPLRRRTVLIEANDTSRRSVVLQFDESMFDGDEWEKPWMELVNMAISQVGEVEMNSEFTTTDNWFGMAPGDGHMWGAPGEGPTLKEFLGIDDE